VIQQIVRVESNREVAEGIHLLRFQSASIAEKARPGQFLNVRAPERWGSLLLRRPFSISRIVGTAVELVYNIVGGGTKVLATQREGDLLDVLGPLGIHFDYESPFETAVLVAGGLGVAPFPFLTDSLETRKVGIITFFGSRTKFNFESLHLRNVEYATDDGSNGFKGTVVECLAEYLRTHKPVNVKIFGCGPTKMLFALSTFAQAAKLRCELSLEGDMACGIGICQGCPVEKKNGPKKYALVCTEGPTFDCQDIVLPQS